MEKSISELIDQALTLPPETRAALADRLIESLDLESDEGAPELWRIEIERHPGIGCRSRTAARMGGSPEPAEVCSRPMSLDSLEFHPLAADELEGSVQWYAARSPLVAPR